MEFFNLKQPPGANKYTQYTAVYSKYTAVYSRVYGRILRYWSLEYTAVYPKSPKWGIFKHNIDHHNWQTRGIPQPTYACIVHHTFVPTCTCHIPLSPKTPFFTRILPGIPGMPGYAHHTDSEMYSLSAVAPHAVVLTQLLGFCMGCSVLGRGAEPLVRTQFLEHPPTLNFGANHQKKWIRHPQKPAIPFLSPHNPHLYPS